MKTDIEIISKQVNEMFPETSQTKQRDIYAVARHGPNSFCVLPGKCATDIEIVTKGVIRAVPGRLLKNPFSLMEKVRDAS